MEQINQQSYRSQRIKMLKPQNKLIALALLILISTPYCIASNDYLSEIAFIMEQLRENTIDLISQRRTVDITKQGINELTAQQEINLAQAERVKATLEEIFDKNFKAASSYERAMYTMKRPLQFVYNKITDPNASYLERFAYGAAAAVGVAVTGYAMYQGGRYAYSALQDWQRGAAQTPETLQALQVIDHFEKLKKEINLNATSDQRKKELYAQHGLIWERTNSARWNEIVRNQDNSFVATLNPDSYQVINGIGNPGLSTETDMDKILADRIQYYLKKK